MPECYFQMGIIQQPKSSSRPNSQSITMYIHWLRIAIMVGGRDLNEYQGSQEEDPIYPLLICNKTLQKWLARKEQDRDSCALSLLESWRELTICVENNCSPQSTLHRQTLEKIHAGNQGVQRCRLHANTSLWWPGISYEVDNMIKQFLMCQKCHTSERADDSIDYPWQWIGTDLFPISVEVTTYWLLQQIPRSHKADKHILKDCHWGFKNYSCTTWSPRVYSERQWPTILITRVCNILRRVRLQTCYYYPPLLLKQWSGRAYSLNHQVLAERVPRPTNCSLDMLLNPIPMLQPVPSQAANGKTSMD